MVATYIKRPCPICFVRQVSWAFAAILSCVHLALYCQNACEYGCLCVCVCVRTLRIVSKDKILCFKNTLIISISIITSAYSREIKKKSCAEELCESWNECPGLPIPNSLYGLCGCKATLMKKNFCPCGFALECELSWVQLLFLLHQGLTKMLLELVEATELDVQREIISALPSIVDDSNHAEVASKLKSVFVLSVLQHIDNLNSLLVFISC